MLYLVGLGLGLKDISVRGLEIAKNCEEVYLEGYTSYSDSAISELESLIGKKITVLNRKQVEEEKPFLKSKKNIALLVHGDPLSATTHIEILHESKEVEIIHASSVLTAVSETGLSLYKFGKVASIPFPQENFKPESFFDILEQNQSINAHTLFLLDLDPENKNFLTISQAIETLLAIAKKRKSKLFSEKTYCVGCAKLGGKNKKIAFGTAKAVSEQMFGSGPYCLIIPSELNFVEKDILSEFNC